MSFHLAKIEDGSFALTQHNVKAELDKISLENPDLPVIFIQNILTAKNLEAEAEPFVFRFE